MQHVYQWQLSQLQVSDRSVELSIFHSNWGVLSQIYHLLKLTNSIAPDLPWNHSQWFSRVPLDPILFSTARILSFSSLRNGSCANRRDSPIRLAKKHRMWYGCEIMAYHGISWDHVTACVQTLSLEPARFCSSVPVKHSTNWPRSDSDQNLSATCQVGQFNF